MVIKMKVYLDLILLLNFLFDFILLLSTSIILKRNTKIYRIILGSLVGSITMLSLFLRMNSFTLFIFKFIVSILMIITAFNYKNIKYTLKNIYYLYIVSVVLAGALYFISNNFLYNNEGFMFIKNKVSINIIFALVLSPLILHFYIKQNKNLKTNYNKYLKVDIYLKNGQIISLNAFLDTGNKLIDPYKKRPIILISKDKIKMDKQEKILLVPYYNLENNGLLKCIVPSKIYIEGLGFKKKFLIGLSPNINIDGVDCILNEKLLEG